MTFIAEDLAVTTNTDGNRLQTIASRLRKHAPFCPDLVIVRPHPTDEGVHVGVAPHPGWESLEWRLGVGADRPMAHIAIDGGRVWPIGFDRHDRKAVLLDQPASDRRTGAIELRCAVAGPRRAARPGGRRTTDMRCRRRDLNVGQQSLIRGSSRMTLLRLGLPRSR